MPSSNPFIIIDTAIVGGPGRGLLQLLQSFKKNSIEYSLCNFRYRRPKSSEFISETEKKGIELHQISQYFWFDPSPVLKLLKLAKRKKPTLIQSHGYKSHLVAFLLARLLNLPWVAFAHGWTAENIKVKLYHKLDLLLLRYATVVITVSPKLQQRLSEVRGPDRPTELILNAIDAAAISGSPGGGESIRKGLGLSPDDKLVGCFGRLSFEKGQDILLRAFAQIQGLLPKVHLVVLGDGIEREHLVKLSCALAISDRVHFRPHCTNVRDYYEAIDLLVLPSRSEGLPNVVLEAMAFSVPVIATDVGAVGEIINNGENGWVIPCNDATGLAFTLFEALRDMQKLKQVGQVGKAALYPKFSPELRAEKIMQVYTTATALGGSRRLRYRANDETVSE